METQPIEQNLLAFVYPFHSVKSVCVREREKILVGLITLSRISYRRGSVGRCFCLVLIARERDLSSVQCFSKTFQWLEHPIIQHFFLVLFSPKLQPDTISSDVRLSQTKYCSSKIMSRSHKFHFAAQCIAPDGNNSPLLANMWNFPGRIELCVATLSCRYQFGMRAAFLHCPFCGWFQLSVAVRGAI